MMAGACYEDPDCIDLRNDYVGFTFKKMFDGKADTVGVLGITASGTDSVFYEFLNVGSSIRIPLNIATTSQSFVFDLLTGKYSMTLDYKSKPQFESVECGPRFVLTDLAIPQHSFDSVRLTSNVAVTSEAGSNIDIYRCPITNNFKISFRQLLANDKENGDALVEELHGIRLGHLPFNYYTNAEVSTAVVPLNLSSNSSQLIVDSKVSGLSSFNISYQIEAASIFEVCGNQNFIKDIEVTGTTDYDFVRVQKDSITDPPSTNIALFKCPQTNLIVLDLSNAPDDGLLINKVSTSYTSTLFYEDSLAASLVLPLDPSQPQTDFTIEFEDKTRQITFGYDRTVQVFHEQCQQTLFSSLEVLSSDFTTPPVVKNDSIQFPTVINFEITND